MYCPVSQRLGEWLAEMGGRLRKRKAQKRGSIPFYRSVRSDSSWLRVDPSHRHGNASTEDINGIIVGHTAWLHTTHHVCSVKGGFLPRDRILLMDSLNSISAAGLLPIAFNSWSGIPDAMILPFARFSSIFSRRRRSRSIKPRSPLMFVSTLVSSSRAWLSRCERSPMECRVSWMKTSVTSVCLEWDESWSLFTRSVIYLCTTTCLRWLGVQWYQCFG